MADLDGALPLCSCGGEADRRQKCAQAVGRRLRELGRGTRMIDDERRILAFVGAHPFVLAEQVPHAPGLSGADVGSLISRLSGEGLLREDRLLVTDSPLVRITPSGLAAIESQMRAPGLELRDVRRDLGAVWVWVAAWDGAFGQMSRVLSGREMDALDRRVVQAGGAVSGFGRSADGGVQYPSVAMVSAGGNRVAVELLLWPWRAFQPEALLTAYRDQLDLDAVLVLVDSDQQVARVKAAATHVGMADTVYVRIALTGAAHIPRG